MLMDWENKYCLNVHTTQNNIQKSIALLYTNNEAAKGEIKKTISFIIAPKRIKYLGINLTKEVMKDPFSENCKTLMKEI